MSKSLDATLTVCSLVVAAVALCWWLWPEERETRIVVELRPICPIESSGDKAAVSGDE